MNGTLAPRAWKVLEMTGMTSEISGYQDKTSPQKCPIVNAITKDSLKDGKEILILMNHATLLKDNDERESLEVPYDMMRHGVMVDISPTIYGGKQGMTIEGEHFPWEYDHEKCYLKIDKPNQYDI